MLSQMGIAIIACLAFNMLLGQGGMLSFGHAVYSGLGSFIAIHALNRVSGGTLAAAGEPDPAGRRPGGLFFAALLGYVTTKKAGTPFAMITLGVGELVAAMSLMFPTSSAAKAASPATASPASPSSASPSARRSSCTT